MGRHLAYIFTSSNLARSSPPTVWQRRGFDRCTADRQRRRGPGNFLLPFQTFPRDPQSWIPARNRYPRGSRRSLMHVQVKRVFSIDRPPQPDIHALLLPHWKVQSTSSHQRWIFRSSLFLGRGRWCRRLQKRVIENTKY